MKRSLTISVIGHVIALIFGLVAISAEPMQAPPVDSLPVEFISAKDYSQLTKGVKNAPKLKVDDIKPLADTVDTPNPVEELAPKVANKPEIKTESTPKPQKSEPKPPDPKQTKSEPKPPDPKPEQKPDKAKAPEPKVDEIAEALKKEEAQKPPKPAKEKPAPAPEKPARETPTFDASQVAALLDKRDPQRRVASAEAVNSTANLGASTGQAAQLSQSEIDALRARLSQCWNPPAGVDVNSKLYIVLRVLFRPDGSLAAAPVVVEGSPSALGPALAESGRRALLNCQPFTMLRPEHYDQWKDIEVKFDPHEMLGG